MGLLNQPREKERKSCAKNNYDVWGRHIYIIHKGIYVCVYLCTHKCKKKLNLYKCNAIMLESCKIKGTLSKFNIKLSWRIVGVRSKQQTNSLNDKM